MDAHGGCARGDAVRVTKSPLGRAPTAKRFGENAAAALLLACTVVAIRVGEFAMVWRPIRSSGAPRSD